MSSTYFFVIVGLKDNPLYETELGALKAAAQSDSRREENRHLNQFIVHSALDMVEEIQWSTQALYLKTVDKFNEFMISAYVSPGNIKFMLLHDQKNEDNIKNFFSEVHELYIKTLMNPFYELNTPITSVVFDGKVKLIAKRYL